MVIRVGGRAFISILNGDSSFVFFMRMKTVVQLELMGRGIGSIAAVALAVCLWWPQFLPAAEQEGERDVYTLFIGLRAPHEANRAALQRALKAEGYEAFPEGDRDVSLALTAAGLRKLFNARVVRRTAEKSATNGTAAQPVLEGVRIPARFGKLIERVYFDPQRS